MRRINIIVYKQASYVHWVSFDTKDVEKVRSTLNRGSNFIVERVYNHPTNNCRAVLQISSEQLYKDLDLEVNSMSSPLRYHRSKPKDLGNGMSLESFERIYGPLTRKGTNMDHFVAPPVTVRDVRYHEANDISYGIVEVDFDTDFGEITYTAEVSPDRQLEDHAIIILGREIRVPYYPELTYEMFVRDDRKLLTAILADWVQEMSDLLYRAVTIYATRNKSTSKKKHWAYTTDPKPVFLASTAGHRYEVAVYPDTDGTYFMETYTRGSSAGRVVGYTLPNIINRVRVEIANSMIDGINYKVVLDEIGVFGGGSNTVGNLSTVENRRGKMGALSHAGEDFERTLRGVVLAHGEGTIDAKTQEYVYIAIAHDGSGFNPLAVIVTDWTFKNTDEAAQAAFEVLETYKFDNEHEELEEIQRDLLEDAKKEHAEELVAGTVTEEELVQELIDSGRDWELWQEGWYCHAWKLPVQEAIDILEEYAPGYIAIEDEEEVDEEVDDLQEG